MFIETYYNERFAFPAGSRESTIPYPELLGEELSLWQKYLPVTVALSDPSFWLNDPPRGVIEELEQVQKRPCLFDRIEIWSRSGDPMAVGVIGGEPTRYFSIARWGDARLTLEQIKKRLRLEKWLSALIPLVMILFLFVVSFAVYSHPGQFPQLAQSGLSYQGF